MALKQSLVLMLCLPVIVASAQKLPAIQEKGLCAPDKVKIDGRLTEWGDKLQAYNSTTQVFYTIANDDTYLYLIVRATANDAIEKINMGGITLTVSSSKKELKNAPAITFPAYDKMGSLYFTTEDRPTPTKDPAKDRMLADSFIKVKNRKLTEYFKMIGVDNIASIPDKVLSIYNEEGIKACAMLDENLNFNCELAIPLKYLGISDNGHFYYNINLNGGALYTIKATEVRTDRYSITKADGKDYYLGSSPNQAYKLFPTDFWGEYTLIKK